MKIVVFGASGFVGQQMVPRLIELGHVVVVVGRSVKELSKHFPVCTAYSIEQFDDHIREYDLAINLATINSDSPLTFGAFEAVNKTLLLDLARRCRKVGVKKFMNVSSIHALDIDNDSFYAISKRQGADALAALGISEYTSVYVPLIYGEKWSGKFRLLNNLPKSLAKLTFSFAAALKPCIHINLLCQKLLIKKYSPVEQQIISNNQFGNYIYAGVRWAVDITFAVTITIIFSWLLLIVWILVKLTSKGPGIFVQKRVGMHGKEFPCFKFRTMQDGTDQRGTHEVNNSSITRIGSTLRKYKLDELPQVLNIFRNEMSIIGPRPCLPNQVELIRERWMCGVFEVKPGISGYAQVMKVDMSEPIRLANLDAKYIALRGLLLDFKILCQTLTGRGNGDNVKSTQ